MGGFSGQNIWANGTPMAPFDQKVIIYFVYFSLQKLS